MAIVAPIKVNRRDTGNRFSVPDDLIKSEFKDGSFIYITDK